MNKEKMLYSSVIVLAAVVLLSDVSLRANVVSPYLTWKGIPVGHGNLSYALIGAGILAEFLYLCISIRKDYIRVFMATIGMNAVSIALGGFILYVAFLSSGALYWVVLKRYFSMVPEAVEGILFSVITIPINVIVEYPIARIFLPMISWKKLLFALIVANTISSALVFVPMMMGLIL